MIGIPVSTLKYYDRVGLFGGLTRDTGIRMFGDKEIETLRVIECLKGSGLEIDEIKQFLRPEISSEDKLKNFQQQKKRVEKEMKSLQKILDMLSFKCWYYEQVIAQGDEKAVEAMVPEELPDDIRKMYDHAREGAL